MNTRQLLLLLLLTLILCTAVFSPTRSSTAQYNNNEISGAIGYPSRSPELDALPGFINPPQGYGDVAFYWWVGDPLTRERLLWQLDQLKDKGITSLQINYCHTDQGGVSYGLSMPSDPPLFTDAWWDLTGWFAGEAQKRGMSVSLSDYTLGVGQGFAVDEILKENPGLNGSVLKSISKDFSSIVEWKLPEGFLSVTAYNLENGKIVPGSRKELSSFVKNSQLIFNPGNSSTTWRVICVYPSRVAPSYDPMNPLSGKAYCEKFFGRFEQKFPGQAGKTLNFFFSDELDFHLSGNLWNNHLATEFKKRKGYDLQPYLDALFMDIGDITPKIKLDYNDVVVSLSEEYFFKPIYQWHQQRGMIFGCDHGGRGRNVVEFGDYFRTQRWNQGPGSDQPGLSKDIIKAKVASSIAHLYQRPRVWLEGFYGSGWGTSTPNVSDAIFANFVAGYNLMSFHGLYYTTHGGWWEWAPPCNHYHMPYWQHITPLMDCLQRMSYLLSQGYHRCDVAVLYPVEPVAAEMDGTTSVSAAFEAGEALYDKGIDFDFMDYESLARSEIKEGGINVSGEKYSVLVVPSMKAIHYASLKKMEDFKDAGGVLVNIGSLPEATEKNGANDAEVKDLTGKIFTKDKNVVYCANGKEVPDRVNGLYDPDFKILSNVKERPYVMHRIVGSRDVYALYNFPQGARCFFKAKGSVELWNPWNGRIASLSNYSKPIKDGTEVTLPLTEKEIQIVVFNPEGASQKDSVPLPSYDLKPEKQLIVDGNWGFELKSVLDNRWGDYEFPAANGMVGAQVRKLKFTEKEYTGGTLNFDGSWKTVTCAFGPQFLKLGPLTVLPPETELLNLSPTQSGAVASIAGKNYRWEIYNFSWQQGVEGDYGHQGYHGLKGEMYDNFIRLGAMAEVKHSLVRKLDPAGNYTILCSSVVAPFDGSFDLLLGQVQPFLLMVNGTKVDSSTKTIELNRGENTLLAVYDKACETYLVFRKPGVPRPARQPISMCWYGDDAVLPFDCKTATSANSGLFGFESAPGLDSFTFAAYGKASAWIDGIPVELIPGKRDSDGLTQYSVQVQHPVPAGAQVVLKIEYQPGYRGAAAIPRYIRQECRNGMIALGDWSRIDGLKAYSGGAWYRKKISINAADIKKRTELDLGNVISTAEVLVNGKSAGIKLTSPWKFDITGMVIEGENRIEVLVYNTLANHYTTIPTRYPGSTVSGLLGPVAINFYGQ
jgi:hypothetical protein